MQGLEFKSAITTIGKDNLQNAGNNWNIEQFR